MMEMFSALVTTVASWNIIKNTEEPKSLIYVALINLNLTSMTCDYPVGK